MCIFFLIFSVMVSRRILNTVPHALQQDLVDPSYKHSLASADSSVQCFSLLPPPTLATTSLFSMSVSLFLFHDTFICDILDFAYVIAYGICLSPSDLLHLV